MIPRPLPLWRDAKAEAEAKAKAEQEAADKARLLDDLDRIARALEKLAYFPNPYDPYAAPTF